MSPETTACMNGYHVIRPSVVRLTRFSGLRSNKSAKEGLQDLLLVWSIDSHLCSEETGRFSSSFSFSLPFFAPEKCSFCFHRIGNFDSDAIYSQHTVFSFHSSHDKWKPLSRTTFWFA